MFKVPLAGKTAIDICIEVLNGEHSDLADDRELLMAACYLLGQSGSPSDDRVIRALESKLSDSREINQHYFDNERGTVGSDFSVNGCAADALALLGVAGHDSIHANHYETYLANEAWTPPILTEVDGALLLLDRNEQQRDDLKLLLREDKEVCAYCDRELPWNWTPHCPQCGRSLSVKRIRIQPKMSLQRGA